MWGCHGSPSSHLEIRRNSEVGNDDRNAIQRSPLRCSAGLIRWTVPWSAPISTKSTHLSIGRSKMMMQATDEVLR